VTGKFTVDSQIPPIVLIILEGKRYLQVARIRFSLACNLAGTNSYMGTSLVALCCRCTLPGLVASNLCLRSLSLEFIG
jgi:hypothetical protein